MKTIAQSQNFAAPKNLIDDAELDTVTGGKATYYEMNGHWYIVGHDKHGFSTGVTQVS